MTWTFAGQTFEACDFTTFIRLHRHATAATTATVQDINSSDEWTSVTTDSNEQFTFGVGTTSPMTVVTPTTVGVVLRRWLTRLER